MTSLQIFLQCQLRWNVWKHNRFHCIANVIDFELAKTGLYVYTCIHTRIQSVSNISQQNQATIGEASQLKALSVQEIRDKIPPSPLPLSSPWHMSQSPPQIYRFTQQFRALAEDIRREKATQMTDRRFKEIHLSEFPIPKLQEFFSTI